MPARTRRLAAAAPVAPQPTMAAREGSRRCWPSGPIPAKSIWREYFSWRESFTKAWPRRAQRKRLLKHMIPPKRKRKAPDRGKIAESLRKLYRTGDYADLQAVVTSVRDGARLDFVVRENLFFDRVRIEGLTAPPSDSSAAAAMQLALGQTYRQAAVDEALERLR